MKISKLLVKLCTFAVAFAGISQYACRAWWYQPEEPENFKEFVERKK